jgi:thioredoxin-like negative regulator of GroEL
MRKGAVVLAAALVAGGAQAEERVGYGAIAAGNWTAAVKRLEAERRVSPERPAVLLNLAAAYRRTGREAEARALYAAVLEQPAVLMDLPSGATASSHALASRGAATLTPTIAAR